MDDNEIKIEIPLTYKRLLNVTKYLSVSPPGIKNTMNSWIMKLYTMYIFEVSSTIFKNIFRFTCIYSEAWNSFSIKYNVVSINGNR